MQSHPEIGGARALLLLGTSDGKATTTTTTDAAHMVVPGKKAPVAGPHGGSTNSTHSNEPAETGVGSPLAFASPKLEAGERHDITGHDITGHGHAHGGENSDTEGPDHVHAGGTSVPAGPHMGDNPEVNELMDKASQLLNDAVEAAVMRYVGGTLDTGEELQGPGAGHTEPQEDEELQRKRQRLHSEDLLSEYQWDRFLEEEVAAGFERTTPRKRLRKPFGEDNEIDPELDGLDGHSEHDQLVHAAIMGAGELAKQLTLPGASPHREPHHNGGQLDRRAPRLDENNSTAISHLAHAATTLSNGFRRDGRERKRPLRKHTASLLDQNTLAPAEDSKYSCSSLESLISQASNEACLWYNTQSDVGGRGPRVFSAEEINIVEHFLRGYCRLNHLSRMDICRRVWTSERPKDNFWESVTKVLPYRSKASVYKHIRRQYHVFQVRAKWTPDEDEFLRKLTESTSTNWKDIGEAMNRMPEDCRDRWRNYIKCGANRVMNKWSEDEEQSLKNIVMEMITNESQTDKPILINWTVVSERMNGVRSRIQCRYKWNKLLRRESISRISMMDNSIKVWMLNSILESGVTDQEAIDWDYIVHMYHETHKEKNKILWTTADFKVAFEKMRGSIREYKNAPLQAAVAKLARSIYQTSENSDTNNQRAPHNASKPINSYEELRPKPFDPRRNAENEAALVANAAVAAVSSRVSEQDAQQQEYSLWR